MALGTTNISISAVMAQAGLPAPSTGSNITWSTLTSYSGINKWARFAPGALSVDSNSDTVVTPPVTNKKIGDFRLYNHTANVPSAYGSSGSKNYIGSGSISNLVGVALPEAMNIWSYAFQADTFYHRMYKSAADRISGANPIAVSGTAIKNLTYSTVTPPSGHSRTSNKVAGSTQIGNALTVNPVVAGFSTPNQIVYTDVWLGAAATGARKMNLGTSKAGAYTQFTAHQQQLPKISGYYNNITAPSGYQNAVMIIATSNTANCTSNSPITRSVGTTTVTCYVKIFAQSTSDYQMYVLQVSSAVINISQGGSTQSKTVSSGWYNYSPHYLNETLTISGGSMSYDETFSVTVSSVVFPGTPGKTAC